MSKTNNTSQLDHAKLENRVLADSELAAVTGGYVPTSVDVGNLKGAITKQVTKMEWGPVSFDIG